MSVTRVKTCEEHATIARMRVKKEAALVKMSEAIGERATKLESERNVKGGSDADHAYAGASVGTVDINKSTSATRV